MRIRRGAATVTGRFDQIETPRKPEHSAIAPPNRKGLPMDSRLREMMGAATKHGPRTSALARFASTARTTSVAEPIDPSRDRVPYMRTGALA